MTESFALCAILTGQSQPFRDDERSAIAKKPVAAPVAVTFVRPTANTTAGRTRLCTITHMIIIRIGRKNW